MKSLFPDICSFALAESREFYVELFGFEVVFEIDWYLQLRSPFDPNLQIAFIARDHPSVPDRFRVAPQGVFVTVESPDVDAIYEKTLNLGHELVVPLVDEEWGQRHFVVTDPNGLPVDVFRLIPPSAAYSKEHGLDG